MVQNRDIRACVIYYGQIRKGLAFYVVDREKEKKMKHRRKYLRTVGAVLLTIWALWSTCGVAAVSVTASETTGKQTQDVEESKEESGTSRSEDASVAKASYVDLLDGKTAGVMTGTPQDSFARLAFPNAKLDYYNNIADLSLALHMGKVDFIVLPVTNYYSLAEQYPEFGYLDMPIVELDIGEIFPKTQASDELRTELNAYIAKIKENGELERLQNYWLYPRDWENVDIPTSGENGVLNLATINTLKPFSFMLNGKNAGFDIAVLAGFGKEYGYGFHIENVDFADALSGIAADKYDLAAGQIAWTKERAENVEYSDFLYKMVVVPIINTDHIRTDDTVMAYDTEGSAGQAPDTSSVTARENENALLRSIRRSLLEEDRWKSVLNGLGVTLVIMMAGFVLANVLGAILCAMAMARIKILRIIADVYSALMQGLPVVVVLMLLYYVVFGHSQISNVVVSILGLGMIFGAYMAQLFENGIRGVDKGQWEAALASGLTGREAFVGIVLPQAARSMLPGYFSNLISLMKSTAVVGYIAVTDLTKVGDIIRSSTFEAVVPLVIVAGLYLGMAGILLFVMHLLRQRLERRQTKKKGGQNTLIDGGKRG